MLSSWSRKLLSYLIATASEAATKAGTERNMEKEDKQPSDSCHT